MYTYRDISPEYRNGKVYKYSNDYELEAIKNSLRNIFLVQKNEVPGKPWFGNPLRIQLFDTFDAFMEQDLKSAIISEVEKFEPRVFIENVKVVLSPENNRIVVTLYYSTIINNTKLEDSLFIPFAYDTKTFISQRDVMVV